MKTTIPAICWPSRSTASVGGGRDFGWATADFAHVHTATLSTLLRSYATRRLGSYGAARLQAQLDGSETLAARLARALTSDVTHLVVAQSLLPFLWREGHLGGRTVEVLMTRLPLHVLHARLDAAALQFPERATLAEFRAPQELVDDERAALEHSRVVTPHREIAALFERRALHLPWNLPAPGTVSKANSRTIAFPGPTAARKGAFEVRAAARRLDLEVVVLGSELEGENFWQGVRSRRAGDGWLDGIAAVVQPALVEEQPRKLLRALAAGVPVVATDACGLDPADGLTLVPAGDEDALVEALASVIP